MRRWLFPISALALAGCTATSGPADRPELAKTAPGACNAEAAQSFLGQVADASLGRRLLEATGARQLRWAPPRSALTMDYRTDRLTVEYDDAMAITRISCG